ncbi:hypothetical protein A2Y85_02135 [candidate division WOR-3 bacterium RBG_13_43_14]|uniref:Histidine kinase/HSP90-like ATPase domain-containing protein n=1 Tax=candidate division WOR-3 bacterium RBG_13_43_14 TaxID=1802590 RepID=A0A1F4U2T0_UNCW3|nr:MAG: hypothetical protein A2Y85_02135 [candidate division WOR-3 bacterium RBG_13_43_14]
MMIMEKQIVFDYNAEKPSFIDLRQKIDRACRRLGLDKEESLHVQIAVDEACTNVVRHAYKNNGGKIRIELRPLNKKLKIVIKDWGNPFQKDYQAASKPHQVIQTKKTGGLGIFTIKKLMNEVKYYRRKNHNELVLTKIRKIKNA